MLMNQVYGTLQNANEAIYVWGHGEVAKLVEKKLKAKNIHIRGFVVDDQEHHGGVLNKEDIYNQNYFLIRGFLGAYFMSEQEIMNSWTGCIGAFSIIDCYEPDMVEPVSKEYYLKNKHIIDGIKSRMEDSFSKESIEAFFNAKVEGEDSSLLPYVTLPQYFFKDSPWRHLDKEILFDCGAYNGDSIKDYINCYGKAYGKIFACEPDKGSYNKLRDFVNKEALKNIVTINCGISDEKALLRFDAQEDMTSNFAMDGCEEIVVDNIDSLSAGEPVSIIKMDIEGFELRALRGAMKTIKLYRPILMISAYHKKDDLINIYNFVNNTVDDYRFYFRCHKPIPIDAVLYAVPAERL